MIHQQIGRLAQRGNRLLAADGGEVLEKLGKWFAAGQVVQKSSDRHARSNEHLLRGTLLTGRAAAATFISLYSDAPDPESGCAEIARRVDALPLPFDAVVLGLGNDGHTASLFPDGDRFAQACEVTNPARVSPMRSAAAGEPRMTLTLSALAAARALYLQIEGAEKQHTLARVLAGEGAYARSPLRALLHAARVPLNVYTCR